MSDGLDVPAAVTRSMLGWGVVAGPFYLVFGLILALTRDGFDLTRHSLSLLSLGEGGWLQILNFVLTGVMVIVAGWGLRRAPTDRAHRTGIAVIIAGAALILAGVFRPDPVTGFPPDAEATATTAGILHLVMGAAQFIGLAVAALILAGTFARRGERGRALASRLLGIAVIVAFLAGAALSASSVGVGLLWIAVLAGFAWLLVACLWVYRIVPHPDPSKR